VNSYQKINHFPCSTEITKKDRLAYSLLKMAQRYGEDLFNFSPETFVLPTEFADFHAAFTSGGLWIVKPANSSQGKGIFIVDDIQDVPLEEQVVVSRYLADPLTANGLKFDIRLYVLITSYEPLRIYLYEEGLVRFASEPYAQSATGCRFVHLTNYSVNKKNKKFIGNQDFRLDDVGHKWSVSALCKKLRAAGADVDTLWAKIYDLIIKTVLAAEGPNVDVSRKLSIPKGCCFDLLGFDVLIDRDLKPWLLEVNLSPSLNTDSPLDLFIKANLISDTLNLIGVRAFSRKAEVLTKQRSKLQSKRYKFTHSVSNIARSVSPTRGAKDTDCSREVMEEYLRKGRFLRIYPNKESDYYDIFFSTPRASNRTLLRKLKGIEGDHDVTPSRHKQTSGSEAESRADLSFIPMEHASISDIRHPTRPEKTDKHQLTGDEILIEYVERLIHVLKTLDEDAVSLSLKASFEQFLGHYVWKSSDLRRGASNCLWQRLDTRLIEMKERRRRLVAMVYRRQGKAPESEESSQELLRSLNASQLEQMLRQNTRDAAHELVSCLISSSDRGALSELIRCLAISAKLGSPIKVRSTNYRRV
jgi:tubulin polyglutamylase TTLL5